MASYFIMSDYPRIIEKFNRSFNARSYKEFNAFKTVSLSAIGGYLKTQIIMATIMFLFTLIGFLILGIDFAFLLAFIVAILDFLPAVGAALILLPMGIFSLINGEFGQGIFLFVMYAGTFILRRTIEPKIMGSQMGLSPLLALFSLYVGMRLGGIPGLILGPIIAVVIIGLKKSGAFDGWVSDIKAIIYLIRPPAQTEEDDAEPTSTVGINAGDIEPSTEDVAQCAESAEHNTDESATTK
jgi:sporulation integral membrane protein YtvI